MAKKKKPLWNPDFIAAWQASGNPQAAMAAVKPPPAPPATGSGPVWDPNFIANWQASGNPQAAMAATKAGQTIYTPQTLPIDPTYDQAIGGLEKTRTGTLAGLGQERTQAYTEYGYTGTESVDPATGLTTVSGLTFNPNDPFSKAALLKQTYDRSRLGTAQSMGATGQLYSGAYQGAQDVAFQKQAGAEDTLKNNLIKFLATNAGKQVQAGTDYDLGAAAAAGDRLTRLGVHWDASGNLVSDNPLYTPSTATGSAPAAASTTTPPTTSGVKMTGRTISAGPGVRGTKKVITKTPKGTKVTYTHSVHGP